MSLPLERAGVDAPADAAPSVPASRRVLLLGCSPPQRELLTHLLAAWRLEACALASPEEVSEVLTSGGAALALVDLGPGSEGSLDGLRALKRCARELPIVALASVRHRSARREARDAGAAAVLTRPVRRDDLRLAIERAVAGLPQAALPLGSGPPPRRGASHSGRRVLLAEDNLVNQKVAARMLERLGLEVDVAGDGAVALELHERRSYDLVLLDCQMPVLDGYQTAQALRRREHRGQHVPIVALTANAMAEDRARCLNAGMDDYLTKPVRLEDLREAVGRWLRDAPQRS